MTPAPEPAPAHWPGHDTDRLSTHPMEFPAGPVAVPTLDADGLRTTLAHLRRGRRYLEDRPTREIIRVLDACAAAWCDRNNPVRAAALDWLGRTTGCATSMLSPALNATFEALRGPHLTALVAAECGGLAALDEGLTVDDGHLHAVGPQLTWIIGAGVVPNAVAVPVFTALLCKSAVVVKTPSREPTFGALLGASLAQVDTRVGSCVGAGWWPGGDDTMNGIAAEAADAVVATGTDETVRSVAARAHPDARVVAYGDRVSVVAVGREQLAEGRGSLLWMEIAEAVGWYEQQGCLSPHVVYVEEGGALAPRQAAERVAEAMALYESKAPRGPVSVETAATLRAHRDRAEAKAMDAERAGVWAASTENAAWVVTFQQDPAFVRSPGYRFVHVRPVYDLEDLPAYLAKGKVRVQAVGLAAESSRRAALVEAFRRLGASRICPVAELQRPSVRWPRDGRRPLGGLLHWMET